MATKKACHVVRTWHDCLLLPPVLLQCIHEYAESITVLLSFSGEQKWWAGEFAAEKVKEERILPFLVPYPFRRNIQLRTASSDTIDCYLLQGTHIVRVLHVDSEILEVVVFSRDEPARMIPVPYHWFDSFCRVTIAMDCIYFFFHHTRCMRWNVTFWRWETVVDLPISLKKHSSLCCSSWRDKVYVFWLDPGTKAIFVFIYHPSLSRWTTHSVVMDFPEFVVEQDSCLLCVNSWSGVIQMNPETLVCKKVQGCLQSFSGVGMVLRL